MSAPTPLDQLYSMMRERLGANVSLQEFQLQLGALGQVLGLDQVSLDALQQRFETELREMSSALPPPIPGAELAAVSASSPSVTPPAIPETWDPPQLIIDWGEWPRVGREVRPELSLICPGQAQAPDLQVNVDRQLDHEPHDPARRLRFESEGNWTCHLPFRMTTAGTDCRPGQYLIDLRLAYRDATPGAPRFFRSSIRLSVPDANSDSGGVLEIDGDGQSIVNLQGYDLRQFSKVVLKGGASSVLNLQNAPGAPAVPLPPSSNTQQSAPIRNYQWKVDAEKQSRLPSLVATPGRPALLKSAMLKFENGRRVLLYPQERISFGRSRDNDVVLRWLPRSDEHDKLSRGISRTHFHAKLVEDGLEIVDESSAGIMIEGSAIPSHGNWALSKTRHDSCSLDLNLSGTFGLRFGLLVTLVSSNPQQTADELMFWDEIYGELAHARPTHHSRKAAHLGIDAVRITRLENLEHEEEYVLLLREATIGGRSSRTTIEVAGLSPVPQARIIYFGRAFWLERLPGSLDISVGSHSLDIRQLIALHPGDEIQITGMRATFTPTAQWYLDGE